MNRILKICCFVLAAGFLLALPLYAQGPDTYWAPQGGSTDFCIAGNWDNGAGDDYRFHIDAGTPDANIDSDVPWTIGFFNPSGGTVNLNSGNMLVSNYMYVNDGGTFNMTGGFFSMVENDPLSIGRDWNSGGPSAGTLNVSGGLFQPGALAWGGAWNKNSMAVPFPDGSTGTVSVSNTGTIDTQTGYIHLGEGGVINVGGAGGGTLRTWAVLGGDIDGIGGGNGIINFDGGTLVCTISTHHLISSVTANLLAGGATVDTGAGFGFLDIPAVLEGEGGLTKKGAGPLTLAGYNTYTGTTTVQEGQLIVAGGGNLASTIINIDSGTQLAVNGGSISSTATIAVDGQLTLDSASFYSGTVNVGATGTLAGIGGPYPATSVVTGGTINPGIHPVGTPTIGTIYLSSLSLQHNSNLNFDITNAANDKITVYGNVSGPGGAIDVLISHTDYGTFSTNQRILEVSPGYGYTLDPNITFKFPTPEALDSPDGQNGIISLFTQSGIDGFVELQPGGALTDPQWNNGNPGSQNYDVASNWDTNTVPMTNLERARFTKSIRFGAVEINLNVSPELSSLIFDNPGGEVYDIEPSGGNSITLYSTITQNHNWHITVLGGDPTIGADIKMAKGSDQSLIRLNVGTSLTLSGALSDRDEGQPARLAVNGNFGGFGVPGVLRLTGSANTYGGPTIIQNGGILELTSVGDAGAASSLGESDASPANFILDGTLRYVGVDATPSTNRGFTPAAPSESASVIEIQNADTVLTLSGNVNSISGGLQKTGPGAVTFTNSGADNVLAAEAFTVSAGSVSFNGGSESIYQIGGLTTVEMAAMNISSGTLQNLGSIVVGDYNDGTLTMSGGKVHSDHNVIFGYEGGYGNLTLSGDAQIEASGSVWFAYTAGYMPCNASLSGTSRIDATGSIVLQNDTTVVLDGGGSLEAGGTVYVSTGSVLHVNGSTSSVTAISPPYNGLYVGRDADTQAFVNVSAGTVNVNFVWLARDDGSFGSLNISGGTVTNSCSYVGFYGGSTGMITMTGGTYKDDYSGDSVILGITSGSTGFLDLSGGTLDMTTDNVAGASGSGKGLMIGGWNTSGATGIVNVRGTGIVTSQNNGVTMGGNSVLNLGAAGAPGGNLQTAFIQTTHNGGDPTISGIVNFHGGTLTASVDADGSGSNPVFLTDIQHAYVYSEGAVIDTNGKNVRVDQILEAPATGGVYGTDDPVNPYVIPVSYGGYGYLSAPYVKITPAEGDTGAGATAIAVMDGDIVDHIEITNPGVGYTAVPTFELVGGLSNGGVPADVGFEPPVTFDDNASGGLTKLGNGTLTLTGDLTYTGTTDIQAGLLQVNKTNTLTGDIIGVGDLEVGNGTDAATLTLTGGVNINGITTINVSSTLKVNTSGTAYLGDVGGAGDLGVGNGMTATTLSAASVKVHALSIGAGSKLVITPSTAGGAATVPVPEPNTLALLALALWGLAGGMWWKRRRSSSPR